MSANEEVNKLLSRRAQYQKLYDEAVNTDLSFANEEKKYQVESTKTMYAQRIAKVDKDLEALQYKEQSEQVQSEVIQFQATVPPVLQPPQPQIIHNRPRTEDADKRSAEEILNDLLGPRYNQKNRDLPGKDFLLCTDCGTHNEISSKSCDKCANQLIKEDIHKKEEIYEDIIENPKAINSIATILIEEIIPSQHKILEIIIGQYSLLHKRQLSAATVATKVVKTTAMLLTGVYIGSKPSQEFIEKGHAILVPTNEGIGIVKAMMGCRSILFIYRYWRDLPPLREFQDNVMLWANGFNFRPALQTTEEYRIWKSQKKKVFSVKQKEERYKKNALKNRAFITRYRPIQIQRKRELLAAMENNPAFSDDHKTDLINSINLLVKQHQRWLKKKKDDPNTKVRSSNNLNI